MDSAMFFSGAAVEGLSSSHREHLCKLERRQREHIEKAMVPAGDHSSMKEQTERMIFQAIAVVDVAMMVPAVVALERDWLAPVAPLRLVLLAGIVAAAFVAVDHLRYI